MDHPTEQRSPFMRFLDAFFQEENIKWMLGAGVCILLGSSLRLVTMHWNECTPVWKYLILLGYTGIVFPLGEFSYHRLALRKTGTFLLALTVLLIPLSFLALHWVRPNGIEAVTDLMWNTGLSALLGINLVWSTFAAHRIFRHFLRQNQPTFLVSFLILCVAGAIVPGLPVAWAPIVSLALWAVFAAGTVKVNRHVFWLAEEHRLPRIFGFFPILLLGTQFLAVLAFGLAGHLSLAWIGLLCTLIALPVLLTADTVARVFEQRTGGLVRPIPWSISGPLMLGTTLCLSGLILSLTGFPASGLAVPTAILAAVSLAVVAHRTQKSAFVWGMVICTMIAYQTSPVFFKTLVVQIRDRAAQAVNEDRLPYAFYGLTYAPLIVIFSFLSNSLKRRGYSLFGRPIRLTACVLPWILVLVSFTHPSAILPVALVLCPIFLGQAVLFRERQLFAPAAACVLAAAYGLPGFCERVLLWPMTSEAALLTWTAAAGLLFVPGFLLDRWSRSLNRDEVPSGQSNWSGNICQLFSLTATLAASAIWIMQWISSAATVQSPLALLLSILIVVLLIGHSLRWLNPRLAEWTLAITTFIVLEHWTGGFWFQQAGIARLCYLLLGQWLLSDFLERRPQTRIARTFARPLSTVSLCGLSVMFGLSFLSWIFEHLHSTHFLSWTTYTLLLAWSLDAARRMRTPLLSTIAFSSLFVFCSAAATVSVGSAVAAQWWMVIWTAAGFVLLFFKHIMTVILQLNNEASADHSTDELNSFRSGIKIWLSPLSFVLPTLFLIIAVASLWFLNGPHRVAGLFALCGMYVCKQNRMWSNAFVVFWPLMNWNLLAVVLTVCVPGSMQIIDLTINDFVICGLPLAALTAISIWIFEWKYPRQWVQNAEIVSEHQVLLSIATLWLLGCALQWHVRDDWSTIDLAWTVTAWFSIAAAFITNGLRTQNAERVWHGQTALLVGFVYLTIAGAWDLSNPASAYLCLIAGLAFWSVGYATESSLRFSVLSKPAKLTGYWLPLCVIPFALWRHFQGDVSTWAGMNSLPLLGAAAFYFWRAMEERQVGLAILSAAILNLATALVWNELRWTDPQLFFIPIGISILGLTELMNREIPSAYHERLRLTGALLILVSPTFQIVTGSWQHILTLMIASVAIALVAIGTRVRVLLYTSSAFLLADLAALVVRGSVDQPNLLWIVGVAVGASVITLGAVCENHRETLLARLRGLVAELEMWR